MIGAQSQPPIGPAMHADDLIAQAAPHGPDFKRVAGNSSNTDGIARRRRLSVAELERRRAEILGVVVEDTVAGNETRSSRRPSYTYADLGLAARGLEYMPWLSACFSIAGLVTAEEYGRMHRQLTVETLKIAKREAWPSKVLYRRGETDYYIEQLGGLVLHVEQYRRQYFEAPNLYAVRMGVEQEIWQVKLARKYAAVHDVYERWLNTARGWIQRQQKQGAEQVVAETA